ncbi:MAG: DUF975 family protein [Lachnospiraceae bacterium]|nr:DUF975 family protein [Lachnospiraceae bacterium]
MVKSVPELKANARHGLLGHYTIIVIALILTQFISSILSYPAALLTGFIQMAPESALLVNRLIQIPVAVVSTIFTCGWIRMILKTMRGEKATYNDITYYLSHSPLKVIQIVLWIAVYMIPAYIPLAAGILTFYFQMGSPVGTAVLSLGIAASLIIAIYIGIQLALSFYLFIDNQNERALSYIKSSITLMKGNRARYLYLMVSFIGLFLLGLISFGIGMLWILPYQQATCALFYENIRAAKEPPQEQGPDISHMNSAADEKDYSQNYWM